MKLVFFNLFINPKSLCNINKIYIINRLLLLFFSSLLNKGMSSCLHIVYMWLRLLKIDIN